MYGPSLHEDETTIAPGEEVQGMVGGWGSAGKMQNRTIFLQETALPHSILELH